MYFSLDLSLKMYTAQICDSFSIQAQVTTDFVNTGFGSLYLKKTSQDSQSTSDTCLDVFVFFVFFF